jgi:hypothetical protein
MLLLCAGVTYGWAVGDETVARSFICEIKKTDVNKIVEEKRDFGEFIFKEIEINSI